MLRTEVDILHACMRVYEIELKELREGLEGAEHKAAGWALRKISLFLISTGHVGLIVKASPFNFQVISIF